MHSPHMYIWKMLPSTVLLQGFRDMVLGASSTHSSQPLHNPAQFTFILFFKKDTFIYFM